MQKFTIISVFDIFSSFSGTKFSRNFNFWFQFWDFQDAQFYNFAYCNNEKAARETKQFLTNNFPISANYVKADFLADNKGATERCFEMFDNEFPKDSFKGCVHNAGGMLIVFFWCGIIF